jgi:hypothetical protein
VLDAAAPATTARVGGRRLETRASTGKEMREERDSLSLSAPGPNVVADGGVTIPICPSLWVYAGTDEAVAGVSLMTLDM